MNESASRQPLWYWGIVGVLMLVGAGALSNSVISSERSNPPQAILATPDGGWEPSVEALSAEFREYRAEVSQLAPAEQQEVWQSLRKRTDSVAEQTLYTFFALPEDRQQALVDRAIDRMEARRAEWQQRFGSSSETGPGRWPVREVSSSSDFNRPFSEMNMEERLAARRDVWTDATQQAHAMRSEFLRLVNERRKLRGLPEFIRRFG